MTTPQLKEIRQHRADSEIYQKNGLPIKSEEGFSQEVIGKDSNGLLGIIFYDYNLDEWLSNTDQFNLDGDFIWSYPTRSIIETAV